MGREELARAAKYRTTGNGRVGIQDQCVPPLVSLLLIEVDSESINGEKNSSHEKNINYICDNMLLGFDGVERYSGSSEKITRKIEGRFNTKWNWQL